MARKIPPPRFEVADLVQFRRLKKDTLSGGDYWLDMEENMIPPGSIGMIVSRRWEANEDFDCWEYDISIPVLGVISCCWGEYAFSPLPKSKKPKKK